MSFLGWERLVKSVEKQKNGVAFSGRKPSELLIQGESAEKARFLNPLTDEKLGAQGTDRYDRTAGLGFKGGLFDTVPLDAQKELEFIAAAGKTRFPPTAGLSQALAVSRVGRVLKNDGGIHYF